MSRFIRPRASTLLALLAAGGAGAALVAPSAPAAVKSWIAGSGNWSTGANWSPIGVPGAGDTVLIGNLFNVENEWVTINQNATIASLSITSGMMLNGSNKSLVVTGPTTLSGYNSVDGFGYPSRLRIDQSPALNDGVLGDVTLSDGAWLEIYSGATLRVNGLLDIGIDSLAYGSGHLHLYGNGPVALRVNGYIGSSTEGLTITQFGTGRIDLDGTVAGDHTLNITTSKIDGSGFEWLTINGEGLTDTFDEDIWMSSNNILTMNLDEGWSMGPNTTLRIFGNSGFPGPAMVNGSPLDFQGHLLMAASTKHVAFNAPVTLAASSSGELGIDSLAEFNAPTTAGGSWLLGDGSSIEFNAATSVSGGDFVTFSASGADGSVDFNGQTTWNGAVSVAGIARQRGNATVSGPTTIDATRFDMDGDGSTSWSIGNSLTVEANYIDTGVLNIFNGSMTISGTFFGKLTVNLQAPSSHWTMDGTMNLGGVGAIMMTRLSGSEMRVTGDLNINGAVQSTAGVALRSGSVTTMQSPSSVLRLSGDSSVETGASFVGAGTLEVGSAGSLLLEPFVWLNQLDLVSSGTVELAEGPGMATVQSFECSANATLAVDIGGYNAVSEHDVLFVASGDAILDGALDVRVIDAGQGLFQPQIGDSFTVLSAPATVTGAFNNAPVSFVPGKVYLWSVNTGASTVAVQLDEIVPCPADLSGDGVVDGADLGLLLAAWGACGGCVADITFDGQVDGADLGMLLASWGVCLY